MAHKKGVGSSKNGRESQSKRLGVKLFGRQNAKAGNILVRQRGTVKTILYLPLLMVLLLSLKREKEGLMFRFCLTLTKERPMHTYKERSLSGGSSFF